MGSKYSHLTLDERRKIERWRQANVSPCRMARILGRHRSTVFRELKRNHFEDDQLPDIVGYFAVAAHQECARRRSRKRKLIKHADLRLLVADRIKDGWTPEQIAGRMRYEGASRRVCQETIYRYIYSKEGLAQELWWYLPTHRKSRKPRRARKRLPPKFHRDVSILFRPDAVAHRQEFGHWEGDLMLFKQHFGTGNVTSLVERVSRFAVVLRNEDRQSKPIMEALIQGLALLPADARQSITFDRGTEFSAWKHLKAGIGADAWFCDPQAPYQKGTVENTNNRLRKYLPRSSEPTDLTNRYLRSICQILNSTPRKCLGYQTPAEVFQTKLLEIQNRME